MLKWLAVLAVTIAALLVGPPGLAQTHDAGPACPYGSSHADGCSASAGGDIQHADFFTGYANQSGQRYATRPPWNVAGVDYPVGIPAGYAARLKDPTVQANLPHGCAYRPSGGPVGAYVVCAHVAGLTLDGFEFGPASGHDCIPLFIHGSVTGTITLSNSHFKNGVNCSTSRNGYLVFVSAPSAASVVVTNDVFDGDALNFSDPLTALLYVDSLGTLTPTYSAFINAPCRPIIYATGTDGGLYLSFNYFEGYVFRADQGHGEIAVTGVSASPVPWDLYSFNTVLEPSTVAASGGTTAIYVSTGAAGAIFTTTRVDHNVTVINLAGGAGGKVTVAASIAEVGYDAFTHLNFDANFTDATGAYFTFAALGGAPKCPNGTVFTGNVNLVTGKLISGYAVGTCPRDQPAEAPAASAR